MKSKKIYMGLLAGLIAGISLEFSLPAIGDTKIHSGSGTGTIEVVNIADVSEPGGNKIQERTLEGTISGPLSGTFIEVVRGVIHDSGLITFKGSLVFTGTAAACGNKVGSMTVGLNGTGAAGLPTAEAEFRAIKKSENTLGVTGHGTLKQVGLDLTYEVNYVCL